MTTRLLTIEEAGKRTGLTPSWLAKLRMTGDGPPFVKLGARTVRYREEDVEAWIASRVRKSTSDTGEWGAE